MRRALVAPRNLSTRAFHSSAASASSPSASAPDALLLRAKSLLANCRSVLAITGAGISTESGIPDYRSPGRPPHRPTSHQQFMSSHATRQRYWARSLQGFDTLAQSKPNGGHVALAYASHSGPIRLRAIITQNVDNLHELAGSPPPSVVHLHGTINHVRCMSCDHVSSRAEYQLMLRELNPAFARKQRSGASHHLAPAAAAAAQQHPAPSAAASSHHTHLISPTLVSPVVLPSSSLDSSSPAASSLASNLRPDGDVELGALDFTTFQLPSCPVCTDGAGRLRSAAAASTAASSTDNSDPHRHGILKPDLVFFGANVPKSVHARADALLSESDGILVVGTSLTVWSAFRLLRHTLDRIAPGQTTSVLQLAEQNAQSRKRAASEQDPSDDRRTDSGSNFVTDGRTTLSPVAAHPVDSADSSPSHRVPSVIPIVILNQGPTRVDPLCAFASNIVKIEHTRASHALNAIFDVPWEVQAVAAERHGHTTDKQRQLAQDGQLHREEYERIAQRNIEAARKQTENIE